MKRIIALLSLLSSQLFAQTGQVLHQEDRALYDQLFESAGEEFNVPADLLRGLSFSETRWTHMRWADDDTASMCSGMPRVYGVMGLWNNSYFGYSLQEAAQLIGRNVQELKDDPVQNIRGAAALLRKYYEENPLPEGIEPFEITSWQNAIAKFSGFPQAELAHSRGLEVYSILKSGYERDRIRITPRNIDLAPIQKMVQTFERKMHEQRDIESYPAIPNDQPDYPLAKWNAAYSGNYGKELIQQRFVVIHDVEGSYLGCISLFKNPAAKVSSQYVLNSHPNSPSNKQPIGSFDAPVGEITQMVEEKYRAWHVGCWNSYMVGIEHEGYYNVSGWYTQECYESSAKLVKYLCEKYKIPKDRNHIISHSQHQDLIWRNWVNSTGQGFDPTCNTHIDPGAFWNWTTYMNLVTSSDTVQPMVVANIPSKNLNNVPAYSSIEVTFNTPMDITSTQLAFSISPAVNGTKKWNSDNTKLTFQAVGFLPWSTTFTVKVDTTAKNIALKKGLGPNPYLFNFTTVAKDTLGPVISVAYPSQNGSNISQRPDVVLILNEPVQTSTLGTTLKFTDINNASVSMSFAKNEVVDDKGVISFSPTLIPNQTYFLKVLPGMKDYYGNASVVDTVIQFSVSNEIVAAGTPLDPFESNAKGWKQPAQSAGSTGIDTNMTLFEISAVKKYSGSYAGKISYAFSTISQGIAVIQATGMPPIDFYSTWGIWVSGDGSGNRLKVRFSPNDQIVDLGTIDWRGWKYFQGDIGSITGPNKILNGIIISQEAEGSVSGSIYVDDLQLNSSISGVGMSNSAFPEKFQLYQNFPNPFNPVTEIQYSIPASMEVRLVVSDILGREIAELVHEHKNAGNYQVSFDASQIPSGIYFYSLRAGGYSESKKMLLVK